jgi:hypothetical protein
MQRILPAVLCLLINAPAPAADASCVRVRFVDDRTQSEMTIDGRILVEALDGGILVEDPTGTLWSITPDRLRERAELPQEFAPLDAAALGDELQRQLGDGFTIVDTNHYVLCTNADPEFARWVGRLFERLMRGFLQTWERADLQLHEPAAPLSAIVFATQQEYAEFATRDAGPQLASSPGYYSVRTNRIVLYDLARASGSATGGDSDINRRVAAAPGNVATIVHEATHQIAFNSGMQVRYADNPVWLTEGLAMYCETPDLDTGSGWGSIGKLNAARLRDYRDFADNRRGGESLSSLISDDARFRDPATAADAYAESWALTYFLIRTRREAYVSFVRVVAAKPRLNWDTADERVAEFEAAFGDLEALEKELQRYTARLGRQ